MLAVFSKYTVQSQNEAMSQKILRNAVKIFALHYYDSCFTGSFLFPN